MLHDSYKCSEFSFQKQTNVWDDNIKMDLQEVGCGGMDERTDIANYM